jgi:hypothetical protein
MHLNNLISKIIAEVLFGTGYKELNPQWQSKIEHTVSKLSADVIKPMQMMNSTLMELEQKLSKHNRAISSENILLKERIQKMEAILSKNTDSKNKSA